MNLVLGALTRASGSLYDRLAATAAELYRGAPTAPGEATGPARVGALDDGGIVVGRARDRDATLVLLGGLHAPLPGWTGPPPTDDPERAARWLLERYHRLGGRFLDDVYGQYAILISDHGGRRLRAACDPSGLRGLFVYRDDTGVTLASNLFTLVRAFRDTIEPDRSLEDFFLVYGYLPGDRTLFQGVRTLPAGVLHTWEANRQDTRAIQRGNPWADRFPPLSPEEACEGEVIDRLYEVFMTAVEEQTGSPDEAAVLLGGVDSALVASALHRLGKTVRTYSFHYDYPTFDQPHTDTLSRFLNSTHVWVPITPEVIRDGLDRYGLIFSRPTNWPNYVIQTARVCEIIRGDGIVHVHSGDGADHTFLGYPRTHALARAYQRLPRIPEPVRDALVALVGRGWIERLMGRTYRVGMNVLRSLARPMPERGFLTFRIFDESSLPRLRAGPTPPQAADIEEMLRRLTGELEGLSPARLAYLGKSSVSANKAKLGGSSDHTGVITYAPYMHPGLKQLSRSLPDRLLRPGHDEATAVVGKYVLLKMAEEKELLPREIIYQSKMAAVDAPVDRWYAGPLKDDLLSLFEHLPFQGSEPYLARLLHPTRAARLYARYLSSDRLTTHEASLLATYAALMKALE